MVFGVEYFCNHIGERGASAGRGDTNRKTLVLRLISHDAFIPEPDPLVKGGRGIRLHFYGADTQARVQYDLKLIPEGGESGAEIVRWAVQFGRWDKIEFKDVQLGPDGLSGFVKRGNVKLIEKGIWPNYSPEKKADNQYKL